MVIIMKKAYMFAAAAVMAALAYLLWQNNDIEVTRYFYTSNKIGGGLDGFKIVHLSDLHGKSFGRRNHRLLTNIEREQPDIIVISGDICDEWHGSEGIDTAIELVAQASRIAPVYYAAGNHEYALSSKDRKRLFLGISDAGGVILENDRVELDIKGEKLYICGMADRGASLAALESMLDKTSDGLALLIAHRPQYAESYAFAGADLSFCGHAHGGQLRLPFIGGLYAPDQGLFPKLTEGMNYFGESATVISRGLGGSRFPFRINNRPELVSVTLCRSFVD